MKKNKKRLLLPFLLLLLMLFSVLPVAAETVPAEINGTALAADMGLVLPADADFSALTVSVADGYSIKGDKADFAFTGSGTLNLGSLFTGALAENKMYTLHIYQGGTEAFSCRIAKMPAAATLDSVYITSDKTVEELNSSKEVAGTGKITYQKADGSYAVKDVDLVSVKGRGNSSWTSSGSKKPYNIKLNKKAELIKGAGKAKKWCLITDRSGIVSSPHLVNIAAQLIYEKIGGDNAVSFQPVNLYINGSYRGMYLLTEKVEIGENRINITESEYTYEDEIGISSVVQKGGVTVKPDDYSKKAEENALVDDGTDPAIATGIQCYRYATDSVLNGVTGGFLLEIDTLWHKEHAGFLTRHGIPYVVKEPDYATREQVQMIAAYVQRMEDAAWSKTGYNSFGEYYGDFIDIESNAKQVFVRLLMGDYDVYRKSTYFAVDCVNGQLQKIQSGPAWDFDRSFYDDNLKIDIADASAEGRRGTRALYSHLLSHPDFWAAFRALGNVDLSAVISEAQGYVNLMTPYVGADEAAVEYASLAQKAHAYGTALSDIQNRIELTANCLNGKKLFCGVTVSWDEARGVFVADAPGAKRYQWYKLTADYSEKVMEKATSREYAPTESGTFFAVAYGPALTDGTEKGMASNLLSIPAGHITETVAGVWDITYLPVTKGENKILACSASANKTVITFDYASAVSLSKAASLTVNTNDCSIVFDGAALTAIAASATVKKTVTLEFYQSAAPAEGYRAAYGLRLQKADGSAIALGSGTVTVTVPYTLADKSKTALVYDLGSGTKTALNSAYDSAAQKVTFIAGSPSLYGITEGDSGNTDTPSSEDEKFVFTDVAKSDYYYPAVYWAVDKGITAGTSKTTFSPADDCTRGQVVTFLWRAAGKPAASSANPFTDVKASDYYYGAVLWAVENGITAGTSKTTFSPEKPCTRSQVVTFLWRAAGKPVASSANPFADVNASDYYCDAVLWAVEKGITAGTSKTTFSPDIVCRRAQIVTFLYRTH